MKKRIILAVTLVLAALMSMCAFAAIDFTFELEEAMSEEEGVYMITAYVTDTDMVYDNALSKEVKGNFRALKSIVSYDTTIFVPYDWAYDEVADIDSYPDAPYAAMASGRNKATLQSVTNSINGNMNSVTAEQYYAPAKESAYVYLNNTAVLTFYFMFADGKSEEDFTSDSFTVDYLNYVNIADNYYNHSDASKNSIAVANNVVPAAPVVEPIYVSVLAGDKVYLQDGSVAVVEAAGDYEVPATVGYVAVNTGYTAQKTYYVDGTSATLVHEDGVVAKDEYSLRSPSEEKPGLRFKMEHATAGRTVANHEIVEVGFIMTAESNKVLDAEGDDYVLDMAMVNRGYAKSGYAYNTADGTDFALDASDDFNYIITGVFYNIPMKDVKTTIAARPYYKVGETYVYGEITKTTLYDVAVAIKASENWEDLADDKKDYVNEIIAQVDGWTEIVEDEVVIDISDLYN